MNDKKEIRRETCEKEKKSVEHNLVQFETSNMDKAVNGPCIISTEDRKGHRKNITTLQ